MSKKKELEAPEKLKLMITIVNRKKVDLYTSILESFNVVSSDIVYANGLASQEILAYLGLSRMEKAVILSVVRQDVIKDIMAAYEDKFFKQKESGGIAFTIPLTKMVGVKAYKFLSHEEE